MIYVLIGLLLLMVGLLFYIFAFGPKLPPETDTIIEHVLARDLPEFVTGETGFAISDGLKIWYERISPESPPRGIVLLLIGMGGNALDWPPKFVRAFLESGYQVIRFDYRSTGISDRVEKWDRKHPYLLADMADDALALLDTLQVQRVHALGLSMGGMIAQELAASHPDRILSLTLLSSSAYVADPDLPSLSSAYFFNSLLKGLPLFKYRILGGEKNLIKERIAKSITVISPEEIDIQETAELVLYDLRKRRGVSISGVIQHQAAVTVSGSRYERIKMLNLPTLVVHGTVDPLIPLEHGKKLVELIPHAEGMWLDGVGHVFPYPHMSRVNDKIVSHLDHATNLARAWDQGRLWYSPEGVS